MFRLYDTRARNVVPVRPTRRGELRMYTCGPTVYRQAHAGNLRSYLLSDLIRRNAERHRLTAVVCQNITDVGHLAGDGAADAGGEDKILAQARAEGTTASQLARHHEQTFRDDCAALNLRPPEHWPRASESIGLMVEMIAKLIETRHAYAAGDGSVYFDARSFPGYGQLSGNILGSLRPGHRSGGEVDNNKRFHADWALWKAAPPRRELTWPAPWGTGFPGWHTECSAMSLHYLGDLIDLHTGGIDLRFPHHEDERAQSDSVAGHEVVRHWAHGGHVLFDGRKMAKSAGNVVRLSDIADRGLDPLALRLTLLEHRYRQQLNLTWETLAAAGATVRRWRARVAQWARSPSKPMCAGYVRDVNEAFDDDLDTPAALRALRGLEADAAVSPGSKFETFAHVDQLLGLDLARDVGRPASSRPLPAGAAEKLQARQAARQAREFAAADRLRDDLAAMGVIVRDTPGGQEWTVNAAG